MQAPLEGIHCSTNCCLQCGFVQLSKSQFSSYWKGNCSTSSRLEAKIWLSIKHEFIIFFNDILNSTGSIVTKTKYIHWRHLKVRKAKSHLSLFDVYLWWCDTSAHRWSYWLNLMWRSYRVLVLEFLRFISVLWTKFASLTWAKDLKDYKGILKTKTMFLCFCILTRCLSTSRFTFKICYWLWSPLPGSNFWENQRWQENSLFWKMPIADKRWGFTGEQPQSSWCWVHWVKHLML